VRIDLNADVGEGVDDVSIFPLVTSINVACGAHAGDVETMKRCVAEARRLGLALGAHPGYPDREGFGRRPMELPDEDLVRSLVEQIAALNVIAGQAEVPLQHVKPHGALYNLAALDENLAGAVARAVREATPGRRIIGPPGSRLLAAAADAGLLGAAEAFADRRYRSDGTLAPRGSPGALIEDPALAAVQAVAVATRNTVATVDGPEIRIRAETVCLHADTPGALAIARAVRAALAKAGVEVAPLASG
jgi:UPF0271 protein